MYRNVTRYEKPRNAIAVHCREDGALKQGVIDSLGREQDTTFINEAGQVEKNQLDIIFPVGRWAGLTYN